MPWSDLDLVVFSGAEQKHWFSLLREALEESNLSFRVDVLEWDSLPDNFKANIAASPRWEIGTGARSSTSNPRQNSLCRIRLHSV
ncbi:MAG: hypothetical protein FWB78_10540 [Treponema sp.]|nr:hypothetical protein [Treponema sp.]